MTRTATRHTLSRFDSAKIDVARSVGLRPDHPAVVEGRTLFPTTVEGTDTSPRFLVSGHNNPKLGKTVLKGPRTGWPIFHVSLEERATCPRSCAMWLDCYGNAMPYARRHTPDAGFIPALQAEVQTMARAHRDGILIRLHALGDFYSEAYVEAWRDLLVRFPQVHVFGYTARDPDAADEDEARIGAAILRLTEQCWDQFAIRFSRTDPGPQRSVVVEAPSDDPQVIMCPAQVEKTTACATCGLCWAEAARDKTIGFLRHGMKRSTGPRGRPPGRPKLAVVSGGLPPVRAPQPTRPPRPVRIAGMDAYEREQFALAWEAEVPPENMARVFECSPSDIVKRAAALGLAPR